MDANIQAYPITEKSIKDVLDAIVSVSTNEDLLAISQLLDAKLEPIKQEQDRINVIIVNEIRLDIKLLAENYIPAARRYEKKFPKSNPFSKGNGRNRAAAILKIINQYLSISNKQMLVFLWSFILPLCNGDGVLWKNFYIQLPLLGN